MKPALWAHLVRRAVRSLWENLYLNAVAAGVIGAAVTLVGVFLMIMVNLSELVDAWDRDVHVSAYFYTDVPVDRRFAVKDDVGRLEEVHSVRYISEVEARAWLIERLPEIDRVLEALGDDVLPASLEITLQDGATRPSDIESFASRIASEDFERIDYGQEWVQRFNSFLSLLQLLGVAMGFLILTAAVFLVGNTMHLVTYARRAELETMKLVGATWIFIAIPFFLEGIVQGVVGSSAAIGALFVLHRFLLVRLQTALQLALGGQVLDFLTPGWLAVLVLSGVVLGVCGSLISVRRFWQAAP